MELNELVTRAQNKDEDAIRTLMNQTSSLAFFVANKYTNNNDDAQEVIQRSYIKAFDHLGDIADNPDQFPSWLSRIITNESLNYIKEAHNRYHVNFSTLDDSENEIDYDPADEKISTQPELAMDQKEREHLLDEMISTLSDEQRIVTMMYFFQDMKITEIAEELQCSENTVKSRLSYAKKKIRECVLELEKKEDIKLYSLSPFAFFLFLLRRQKGYLFNTVNPVPTTAPTIKKISTPNKVPASAVHVVTAAGKTVGISTAAKIGIGAIVASAAIAGTAAVTGVIQPRNTDSNQISLAAMASADIQNTAAPGSTASPNILSASSADTLAASASADSAEKAAQSVWAIEPTLPYDHMKSLFIYFFDLMAPDTSSLHGYSINGYGYFNIATDRIQIEVNNKTGIMDYYGNVLIQPTYDGVYAFDYFMFKNDSSSGPEYCLYSNDSGNYLNSNMDQVTNETCMPPAFGLEGPTGYLYQGGKVISYASACGYDYDVTRDSFKGGIIAEYAVGARIDSDCDVKNPDDPIDYVNCTSDGTVICHIPCKYRVSPEINGYTSGTNNPNTWEQAADELAYFNAETGEQITDFIYSTDSGDFYDGFAAVEKNGKWAYINGKGQPVTDFIFEEASDNYQGHAYVKYHGMWGLLNLEKYAESGTLITADLANQYTPVSASMNHISSSTEGTVTVLIDKLNIRSDASQSASRVGTADKTSYPVYESKVSDGYTWYRIAENEWIASKEGEWTHYESN
ncbi:MAG: sigma-70 family RNA polymerase sigma factor [Atopobium sp.]|nr:sigma-70 family RNA polymerase sigma factor [Atopobium sp.]